MKMVKANAASTRLEKLKALADTLAKAIDAVKYQKDLPPLARQYRETIREIEELAGSGDEDDVAKIIEARRASGKSGAVRKNRAKI